MKMKIRKFDELNEGFIGDWLKKMMVKMLPEDLQKKIAGYQQKFGKSKNQNDLLNNIKSSLEDMQKEFNEKIKPITQDNISDIKKVTSDNLGMMYLTMKGLSTATNNKGFLPENFFAKSDFNKMFAYEDPKDFEKNLPSSTMMFLTNVGKKSGVKDEQIKKMFEETTEQNAETEQKQSDKTEQNTQTEQKTQETLNIKKFNQMYEADVQTENITESFDIEKFKTTLTNEWKLFTENIYKGVEKTIKLGANNAIITISKQNSQKLGSKPENLQKIYSYVTNLDKEGLIELRDVLAGKKILKDCKSLKQIQQKDYLI